jgi:CHAT domain-containing protein
LLLKQAAANFAKSNTLAFAPFATNSKTALSQAFSPLPFSGDEVAGLAGAVFSGAAATKDAFLKNVSRFPVVHLATHAVVNDSADNLSYIAFAPSSAAKEDYLLYAREIYNLPLQNTELVILSACETASGNLVRGEGVMSLSRAFAYAGCSNIVTSLWKANDESTAYLSKKLHAYLRKGFPVDVAMQQAKLDLLSDSRIHPRLKQPFYWANLIFVGDYAPVEENRINGLFVALAVCIAILAVLIGRIKQWFPSSGNSLTNKQL